MRSPELRRALALTVLVLAAASTAKGQPPPTFAPDSPRPGFLPRFDAVGSVEALSEHDTDYYWDADIALGVDVADFGRGRVHVLVGYEMVLGSELQPFDPWQGNYAIDVLGTLRAGATEWGLLFHHVSRHLGDRPKRFGIAWNDLGLQVMHTRRSGEWRWQARGAALGTVARGFVDYAADTTGELLVERRAPRRANPIGAVQAHVRFVHDSAISRSAQWGARAETGVRLAGGAAVLEIVAGVERRIDADPFAFAPRDWAFAGLRLRTR